MAARRCSLCGINFPNIYASFKCPIHDVETSLFSNIEPDEDWAEQAARLKGELVVTAWAEGVNEYIPTIEGKVTLRDGNYFVDSRDVVRSDIHRKLRPTELIRIGVQVFEILGYSYAAREYWVRPFSMELSDEDLEQLSAARS